jgi:hypothetical protein
MPIQTAADSISNSAGSPYGFKNRIINGAMAIDQRGVGTLFSNANGYTLDRWYFMRGNVSSSPVFNVQQSTTAPAAFKNSLYVTVNTSGAPGSGNYSALFQRVEGYNCSDLGYGASGAVTTTLSFWVNCSVSGTYGVAFQNDGNSRSYIASYTINSPNTWEYKTIILPGDTTGTWLTNNATGLAVYWDLGVGTGQNTTAGSWQAGNYLGLTGGTKLSNTANATFYITGVQLEKGSQATAFDYRPFSTELQLCQRYYEKSFHLNTVPANQINGQGANVDTGILSYSGTSSRNPATQFKVNKRTAPTITAYSPGGYGATGGNNPVIYVSGTWYNYTTFSVTNQESYFVFDGSSPANLTTGYSYLFSFGWTASAEL